MSVYLIDYENVQQGGFSGMNQLNREDQVLIFYSENAEKVSLDFIAEFQNTGASVAFRKINKTGKNYLDFQLAAMSGVMVASSNATEYYIVSKDKDFDPVVDFFNENDIDGKKVRFARIEKIGANKAFKEVTKKQTNKKNTPKKEKQQTAAESVPKELKNALRRELKPLKIQPSDYTKVYKAFLQTENKLDYHNFLVKEIQNTDKANKIYKATVSVFEEK